MDSFDLEADKKTIREKSTSILELVEGLKGALTSEDDAFRSQGVDHLAEVIKGCPGALRSQADSAVLAAFFADKLTDRACIGAALKGCLALLSADQPAVAQPAPSAHVTNLAETVLRDVPVQALSQANRQTCLQLILALIKEHGEQLLDQGVDLIQGLVTAVDGERDPRCLLLVFEAIQALVHLHSVSASEAHRNALRSKSEDLCDIIACYFPITFRLQPNSPHGITRDDLAAALQAAMRCTPLFAPQLVPLLLEKLSSSLWQAKVDALSALAACVEAWGAAAKPHLARLWPGLRNELTDAAESGPGERDIGGLAAECLRRCIAALEGRAQQRGPGEWSLLVEVLDSESIADVPQWLLESSSGEAASLAKQVATAALILNAVAGASVAASRQVCRRCMVPLLTTVEAGEATPVMLAMSIILAIVQGAKASARGVAGSLPAEEAGCGAQPEGPLLDWGPKLLKAALSAESLSVAGEEARRNPTEQKIALQRLQIVASLAAFPADSKLRALRAADHATAINFLLDNATRFTAAQADLAAEATRAIAEALEAGHQCAVAEHLPSLLEVASRLAPGDSSWAGQPALDCVVAICQASPSLRKEILQRLTEDVSARIEEQAGTEAGRQMLAAHLAALAERILPACSRPYAGPEASSASSLAERVMTAVHALSTKCKGEAAQGIEVACASAVQLATAGCDIGTQEPIARCAAGILANVSSSAAGQVGKEQEQEPGTVGRAAESAASMVACSALIGLRPGVSEQHMKALFGEQQAAGLLRAVLSVALTAAQEDEAHAAMAAVASLLFKWPSGTAHSTDAAVAVALDEVVLPRLQLQLKGDPQAVRLRAVGLLGWLAKGLAMRGHARASKPLDTALAYLEAASLDLAAAQEEADAAADQSRLGGTAESAAEGMEGVEPRGAPGAVPGRQQDEEAALEGWEDAFDAAETLAMAGVFETVLAEGPGVARLDESTHARGRLLWKQKVFTEAARGLQEKLQEGVDFLGSPPAPLLLGLARLVQGAPKEVLKGALPGLLPWLLSALGVLSEGPLADGPALAAILSCLGGMLAEEAGCKALEEHISQLVPALLANAAFSTDPGVRCAALSCLQAAMQLPYTLLHPHRSAVLKALAVAVDDPKRAVRMQAARSRQAWLP